MLPNDNEMDDSDSDDDELPYTPKAKPAIVTISSQHRQQRGNSDEVLLRQQRRSATHAKLCAYESKRRTAYEAKLQSSFLYWHAFRTLMHDSLLETQKAYLLVRGWNHASKIYGDSMSSIQEWCIDEKEGAPILDGKKKKKFLEKTSSLATADYYREEQCGSIIHNMADVAGVVATQYDEMVNYIHTEVLPELSLLSDHLKSEVVFMEKLGDSIMNELETAEDEVCNAWDAYYRKSQEFFSSSPSSSGGKERLKVDVPPERPSTLDNLNSTVKEGCADVWVVELRYRMAVAFLSSVWDKCSSELSKLFLSMKDAECNRRNVIKDLMIKAVKRQESQWHELPSLASSVLKELEEWPTTERKVVEDDVQNSIRERAQNIQRDEAMHKTKTHSDTESSADSSGLAEAQQQQQQEEDGNFELSSPLVSDLMCRAKVIEKRSPGMMSAWKLSLAVITLDSFLHLFELPPTSCKQLHAGSAPELAFQNLIPPVLVPSMEGLKEGVKVPTAKHWFDNLVPSESFALPNCVMSLHKDEEKKNPNNNNFEIVETLLTSGASKMFTKTVNRKMQFRTVTREDAQDFVDLLKSFAAASSRASSSSSSSSVPIEKDISNNNNN